MKNLLIGLLVLSTFSAFANCEISGGLKLNSDGSKKIEFMKTYQNLDLNECVLPVTVREFL